MGIETILTNDDLKLFNSGEHIRIYNKFGAHITNKGVHFAVWAPNAQRVSVICGSNKWRPDKNKLQPIENSGVWAGTVENLAEFELYKYAIETKHYGTFFKSDPIGFFAELRPNTASILFDLDKYKWKDSTWIAKRQNIKPLDGPVNILKLHLGSWMRFPDTKYGHRYLTYRETAEKLIPFAKEYGFTHIEFLPNTEHPLDESWGYQVGNFYAITSRFGKPDDFMYLIDTAHQNDLGIIMDSVLGHFPKDASGLAFFDGTHAYEHEDPRIGEHKGWGTKTFNSERNEVRSFLLSNPHFFADKFHMDGFRVDAVSSMIYLDYDRKEWIPNIHGERWNLGNIALLKKFNETIHKEYPGIITAAEESTDFPGVTKPVNKGGLGFDLKWNMGWMNDMLKYMGTDPLYRKYEQDKLTFSIMYMTAEQFILSLAHDEVVHGKRSMLNKMPGNDQEKAANLRAFYAYKIMHPGKKLQFIENIIAPWTEWNSTGALNWDLLQVQPHKGIAQLVQDINRFYIKEPALYELDFSYEGFEWIDIKDKDNSIISFIRKPKTDYGEVICVCNFTPVPQFDYRVGVVSSGFYKELINTDSVKYGGSNLGNSLGVEAEEYTMHDKPYSIKLTLPPLSTLILKRE